MRRVILTAFVLAGLSLLLLPALNATGEDWKTAKTKVVQLGKTEYSSPVLKNGAVGGDFLALPVEGGKGLPIKVTPQKVNVDLDFKGKFDFVAAQGAKSTPFEVKLVYEGGEKTTHSIQVLKQGSAWVYTRASGVEASIEGAKILLLDDNNNGIFGEEGADGLYIDKKEWGAPLSRVIFVGGKLYEIEFNKSATELKYRPFEGQTGKVDLVKEWKGAKTPEAIIVQGSTQAGSVFLDLAGKGELTVPTGTYNLVSAHMSNVLIRRGNKTTFEVAEGATATMKWGLKLSVSATASLDKERKQFTVHPVPKVIGEGGEEYSGPFMSEDPKFKFIVQQTTANGKPVGRETTWAICFS